MAKSKGRFLGEILGSDGKIEKSKTDAAITAGANLSLAADGTLTTTTLPLSGGTLTGNVNLGDNVKAQFGAGNDLQIYHDGSTSIITDQGTGFLALRGDGNVTLQNASGTENKLVASTDGAVTLYHNNVAKIATTSTGIDVTGSVTADGLTVDAAQSNFNDSAGSVIAFQKSASAKAWIANRSYGFHDGNGLAINTTDANPIRFGTNNTERMRVDTSGNLGIGTTTPDEFSVGSTYKYLSVGGDKPGIINLVDNSTNGSYLQFGTAAGLRRASIHAIDGSHLAFTVNGSNSGTGLTEAMRIKNNGNIGIGTTAPQEKLHVYTTGASRVEAESTTGFAAFKATNNSGSYGWYVDNSADKFHLYDFTDNANRITVDGSGSVGIGTASPPGSVMLDIKETTADADLLLGLTAGTGGRAQIRSVAQSDATSSVLSFHTMTGSSTSEAMRIDANGSVFIASTSDSGSNRHFFQHDGFVRHKRANLVGVFDRDNTDGDILKIRKDGSDVGTFGSNSGQFLIDSNASNVVISANSGSSSVITRGLLRPLVDNTDDLGQSNRRFQDLHLSGTANVGGNLVVTGNLTINGTTTTLNTATLDVEDKNITLNYGSGDTTSTADGAGITIQDAVDASTDASLTWRASDDKFIFSHPLRMFGQFELPDSVKLVAGDGNDLQIYHDGSNGYVSDAGDGYLVLMSNGPGIRLNSSTAEIMIDATPNGAVTLYHNNSAKLATTSTGVSITGKTVFSDDITVGHSTTGTHSTSTSATTQATIASFTKTVFRSAKYLVQVTNSTDSTYHTTEILVIHDGTDTYMTEYGSMFTGAAAEATFTSDVTGGGLVRLLATPASTDSMTFKVIRQNITV